MREVIARIADHPMAYINELLPWRLQPTIPTAPTGIDATPQLAPQAKITLNLRSICHQDGLQKALTFNLQPGQECGNMGKIVFGMMQSLDGYVAGVEGELEPPLHSPPGIALFRYWIDHVRDVAGSL
jgi:hypothetical protein